MEFSILIEKFDDNSLPEGHFFARIPALDLTAHGPGIKGAEKAAEDLVEPWRAVTRENSEPVRAEAEAS